MPDSLRHSVQSMVTTKQVVTNWNYVVQCARRGEENDDKRQRENDRPVVSLQYGVESCHYSAPGMLIRLLLLPRSYTLWLQRYLSQNYA